MPPVIAGSLISRLHPNIPENVSELFQIQNISSPSSKKSAWLWLTLCFASGLDHFDPCYTDAVRVYSYFTTTVQSAYISMISTAFFQAYNQVN